MAVFDVIDDIPVTNKTIFLRCDFDVPLTQNGAILDDRKIKETLKTINYLTKNGARVVIGTHIGNPKGARDEQFSTRILAEYLNRELRCEVFFCNDCIGEETKRNIFRASYGDVVMLENLRFHKEEYTCDLNFAKSLAEGMNIYVNDTFSVSNHTYASILGVPMFIRATGGFALQKEVDFLNKILGGGNQNIVAIIGGNNLATKFDIINNLIERVGYIFLCGSVANTFLASAEYNIGKSIYEPECMKYVEELLKKSTRYNCIIGTPEDVVVAKNMNNNAKLTTKKLNDIEDDDIIVDAGFEYLDVMKKVINSTKYIVWNGTIGMAEFLNFCKGDREIINYVADLTKKRKIISLAGGKDTNSLINKFERQNDFSFLSYSGLSYSNYLAGKVIPGLEILYRLSGEHLKGSSFKK